MATSGFYDQNKNRAFPFLLYSVNQPITGPVTLLNLPNSIIVDAGFIAGSKSNFDTKLNSIYLFQIRRVGDTFFFDFASDAISLSGVLVTFTRELEDENYLIEFSDSGDIGLSESDSNSVSVAACEEPLWSGYMVSGDMSVLDLFLPSDGVISNSVNSSTLEPSLIQNLSNGYVARLGLANDDRTRVTSPDNCPDTIFPYPVGGTIVSAVCLLGNVLFKPGYNATIRQDDSSNSITIGAAVGASEGEPCYEIPLFSGEVPPEGSDLLEGGPLCGQTLRSLNGIGGKTFAINAGTGVTITESPSTNSIIINVDMSGLALCSSDISTSSQSV